MPHKAFEVAIDSLSQDDTLIIIGPDSENPAYKKFLEMKAHRKNVHITGELLANEKDSIIFRSTALIVNSSSVTYRNQEFEQSELFGLVIIESILNNTLPITSSQPALKEVMKVLQLERLVYQERNSNSLSKKMQFVTALSSDEYKNLVEQAKKIIRERFLWDNYWQRVEKILNVGVEDEDFIGFQHISSSR